MIYINANAKNMEIELSRAFLKPYIKFFNDVDPQCAIITYDFISILN